MRVEAAASRSRADELAALPPDQLGAVMAGMSEEEAEDMLYDWRGFNARPEQVEPDGEWDIWLILSGRGWGKTRTGAEWVKEKVEKGEARRIALVAETSADARDVMVEGDSGIMSLYPPGKQPLFEPSKRRLTWPEHGAIATLYNATEPDQLRGPQHDLAWSDELAKWKYCRQTWDQLQFGLRIGQNPRQLVTTTPRPIETVKAIFNGEEGKVRVTRGNTLDNAGNLAPRFLAKITKKYENTRLGRQELAGEILGDFPNALWTQAMIDQTRVAERPKDIGRMLVSVDPAASDDDADEANENGIIVGCTNVTGDQGYIIEDGTIHGSPQRWARRAIGLYRHYEADAIVVEVNQGGAMVAHTVRSVASDVPIIEVRASRGKHIRAEPISALYEQGRISHVGAFPELEQQMVMMTTAKYQGDGSPDRLDAMVWLFTELFEDIVNADERRRSLPQWTRRKGLV